MAGIVKWWRNFKQYKQFTVLQECTTDSEELIYRAPSTCSAPPDLLMSSREQLIVSDTTPLPAKQHTIKHKEPQARNNQVKMTHEHNNDKSQSVSKRNSTASTGKVQPSLPQQPQIESQDSNRVRLEEFTCDVSVEDVTKKQPQPIQFSFTLYDLDGHGKITKDDIAGIVSTIYDSIGKSVVVPHYGKKTINVRLTVSPDAAKQTNPTNLQRHNKMSPRRKYRPRAILSDEDEEEEIDDVISDSTSDHNQVIPKVSNDVTNNITNLNNSKNNVYESINNLKCTTNQLDNLLVTKNNNKNILELCKRCPETTPEKDELNYTIKQQQKASIIKKKMLRKSRARRQRSSDAPVARVRSLSVGNENKWKHQQQTNNILNEQRHQEELKAQAKPQDFLTTKDYHQWNNNALRRDELIEIIRESMEKNRLCFQGNRKTENSPIGVSTTRQRSNTISKMVSGDNGNCNVNEFDQQHLCAFDSFLHATICSNIHSNVVGQMVEAQTNTKTHATNVKMNNKIRMKQLNHSVQAPALKLRTSVLNQFNPNLTPEQKLSRKLNDVEKWLLERDTSFKCENESKNLRLKDDKNILNPNVNDKLTATVTSTPKKVFNKEVLITKKIRIPAQSKDQQQQLEQHKLAVKESNNNNKNESILEYSNFPVNVNVNDCENLIIMSDDDLTASNQAPTAILINNKHSDEMKQENITGSVSQASESTSKSSQDSVHRYVHIHHHYYHFENDE